MQRARRRGNEGKTQHTLSAYRVPDQRFTCTNTPNMVTQGPEVGRIHGPSALPSDPHESSDVPFLIKVKITDFGNCPVINYMYLLLHSSKSCFPFRKMRITTPTVIRRL